MTSEGFLVDIQTAELFFRACHRFHIESREGRMALMRELVRRKKAKYLRDVQPLLTNKKVLKIGFKSKEK